MSSGTKRTTFTKQFPITESNAVIDGKAQYSFYWTYEFSSITFVRHVPGLFSTMKRYWDSIAFIKPEDERGVTKDSPLRVYVHFFEPNQWKFVNGYLLDGMKVVERSDTFTLYCSGKERTHMDYIQGISKADLDGSVYYEKNDKTNDRDVVHSNFLKRKADRLGVVGSDHTIISSSTISGQVVNIDKRIKALENFDYDALYATYRKYRPSDNPIEDSQIMYIVKLGLEQYLASLERI